MRDFFDQVRRAEWERVRRRGRESYIWRQHVLPFGLPFGLWMTYERFEKLGWEWDALRSRPGAATAYVAVIGSMLFAYGWGFLAWRRRVKRYGA